MSLLCRYEREGLVSGHWCNECPPDYSKIEKEEILVYKEKNKKKKDKDRKWNPLSAEV
jgi:hypothetical protein